MNFIRKLVCSSFEKERDDLLINSTDDLQRQFDKQKLENEQQKLEIERLRQALVERDGIIEEQDKRLLTEHETQAIQTVFLDETLLMKKPCVHLG